MAVRPASALERYFSCSSPPPPPLPRCCCCQPSRCTALHRAVTKLDDALPHGLLHRRESRSSTPACYRSNRPSHSASRCRLPLRGAPRTQLLPARLSQRQPVGAHAAGPDHQLRANFPGARAARSASPPRSGARRKKWAWWGTGRTRFATEVDTKVFYGENLFCRQSRETCGTGLGSRGSRGVFIVYKNLSEGLPRERTSPSARRGGRPPVGGWSRTPVNSTVVTGGRQPLRADGDVGSGVIPSERLS